MRLPDFKLEKYLSAYEFNTRWLLCCSDCETLPIGRLLDLEPSARERLDQLALGYTPLEGSDELREEISRLYREIGPARILVHTGAEEAIHNFMQVLLHPGDRLIVQWPCYQSLFQIAEALGCRVDPWELKEEEGWRPDVGRLEALIRPETKAVIVNSPHNPTGALLTAGDQAHLIRLAEKHNFTIFSDEVYRLLEYRPEDRPPSLCDLTDRAVSLGVMSKSYGLAGLRIGWIAARDPGLYEGMLRYKDYTTICNPAPSEFLAALALRHKDRIVGRNLEIINRNLDLLDRFFARYDSLFKWQRPMAGPIAFPSLRDGLDAEPYFSEIVEQIGVLLLPGVVYGDPYRSHFRVGFGRENLARGLEVLEAHLAGTVGKRV